MPFPSRLKRSILIGVVVLGTVLVLFRESCLFGVGDFLIVQDTLHPGNVIHVIAGEDYRTDYAIQLYREGYGKTLFFTGGWCRIHNYNHGEHAKELALARGVPLEAIVFDDASVTSTYMEVERLHEWISHRPTPIHAVVVVSDPFHMRRARWAYRRVLNDSIELQMAPVPFELTPYQRAWWTDSDSRTYVREEYEKFIYYILRYQLSWGKFQEWLATLDKD